MGTDGVALICRAQLYVLRLMNARVAENSMTGKSAETISHNIWRDGGAWVRRFIAVFTSLSHKDRGAGAGGGLKCDL